MRLNIKKRTGVLWGLGLTLTAIAVIGAVVYTSPANETNAAGETILSPASVSGRVNQQIAVSGVSIGGTGNDVVPVKIQVSQGTVYVTQKTGITFVGASVGSTISFTGTRTNVNAALATLHYSGSVSGSDTLTISLADQNTIFNPSNNHVYQYIPNENGISWYDARDEAATLSYDGVPGYLATITSQDENDFIKDRLNGDAWLGASDDDQYGGEDVWQWIAGPEAGTNFYNGNGSAGGAPVGANFANWAGGEPNNAGNEDCMETYISTGTWNDLPCDATISGYVVEYGDDTTNPGSIPTADVTITTSAAVFAGGDGSLGSPYQLTDCEQLQNLNQDLSAHYVLNHDIDCTDTPNWNGGQGFLPIGGNLGLGEPFIGTIEGNGYSIDGLTEIRADDDPNTDFNSDPATNQNYVGLFGYTADAAISGVHLTNAKIKGFQYVGGLVGYMSHGSITNSSVNEGIDESEDTSCTPGYCVWARYGEYGGGLVGFMVAGSIDGSTVGGLVKGSGNVIGGLVGHAEFGASISNSSSTAAIDGGYNIGGAVGEMYDSSTLHRVFATGDVIAKTDDEVGKAGWYAGGLVGQANNSTVTESYATGAVHADQYYAGGLAGSMSGSTVSDVYASGDVYAGGDPAGGLLGAGTFNTITNAYASGSVTAVGGNTGGLLGSSFQDTITASFAVGEVTGPGSLGALVGSWGGAALDKFYYDATTTGMGATQCDTNGVIAGCNPVNTSGTNPGYFNDYRHAPFMQASAHIWDIDDVWYFSGTALPVLRIGVNSTASALPDDNDGTSAVTENAAPNSGDGNNDGTLDSEQANVVSFVNPVTSKYVTLEVDSACSVMAASSAVSAQPDSSFSYPFGLVNYTIDCGTPGFSTAVTIYYHNLASASGLVVRKYNSTTHTYATISSAVVTGANPVKVTYTITDGSVLDEDGVSNGIIVDPVGLASPQVVTAPGTPNTGEKPGSLLVFLVSGAVGLVLLALGARRLKYSVLAARV